MLFNSPVYGVFLVACFAIFWAIHRYRLPRALFLVVASYGFYFYGTLDAAREQQPPLGALGWSVLCLAVIFVGSTIDFAVGRALGREKRPAARKALLLVSIVYYLGILSVFKYFNFAVDSFADLAHALGWNVSPVHLRLVLPFGISFFTFETMSYTIDVYRGELPPAKKYLDYLLFVCFFPHLVAGPIVRPRDMLPQFDRAPLFDEADQARGLWLIATGLLKKIVIGDLLAVNLVKRVFDNPERFSSIEVLVAVYAYAIQIYADFSGYTDVAIGSAQLFGYQLPKNFDVPYTAQNLQDFWHRWHISLSTWLRDYLYIPLGGSRKSSLLTYRNLMITMVLGGLWHGASWNFVIWGALHGIALAGTRMWQRARQKTAAQGSLAGRVVSVFLTFQYVCFAWIFFRAPTFAHAKLVLARIATGGTGTLNLPAKVVAIVVVAMLVHFIPKDVTQRLRDAFVRAPAAVQGIALAGVAFCLHLAAGSKAEPFVYGQF
ncbi:MAG TPA: MBOAT family protein [Polyangiaceae bacterium]|nr:MBOAT family protein [Polyangiaceae bacterium]